VRLLAHLSDLHFGRVEREVLELLLRRVCELRPHLVVISGDLTQRARARQFREARAFLDRLPRPQLVVPGNHDVPLYNVLARFLRPFGGYRRFIAEDLEPGFDDEEIAVLGINTARSFVFKGGRVSEAQLERVGQRFRDLDRVRIMVSHHPLTALERLDGCVDLFLAGHLHAARRTMGKSALLVQAGTATSSRTRAEPNSFNLLRIAPRRIEVEQYELRGGAFVPSSTEMFRRENGHWRRHRAA
jgi:predicted MPP superfamily phosphohydrolase